MKRSLLLALTILFVIGLYLFLKRDASVSSQDDWQKNKNAFYHFKKGNHDDPCFKTYEKIFSHLDGKTPASLSVSVIFGYKDVRPARFVGDLYERINLVTRLQKACPADDPKQVACEFSVDPDDQSRLLRKIMGPRGDFRQVELRIINSSISSDDQFNRLNPFQDWQSRQAQEHFVRGLEESAILLYYGHSRDGGGPDFFPPRLRDDQHVDYAFYEKNQPGLKKMLGALRRAQEPPQLIGLYSCVATGHFAEEIHEVSPSSALITSSKLVYVSQAIESLYQTLNAVLSMQCESDFRRSVLGQQSPEATQIGNLFNRAD